MTGTWLFATKPHLRNAKLFTQHTLVNLSQRFLTPVETKVLAKGMNFALTPKHYWFQSKTSSSQPSQHSNI